MIGFILSSRWERRTWKGEPMEILEQCDAWLTNFRAGWLAHHQQTGEVDWKRYERPRNKTAPAGPAIDLTQSRLMLISSSGAYLPGQQEPFDAGHPLGDYSIRTFPSSTPLDRLAYAHEHYEQTAVDQDPQVLLPLRHLEDLVAEGVIGELSPSVVSFMGYQPDAARVVDDMIPAILQVAVAEQAQAVLLVQA
jgi:hypothetical protein